ncbi:hypothetical protein DY000_02004710 [Brassica cretica]|uniref:Uncharacterized protein n=1 Tax=Brassica cretica TaxID=69181 RepID=A0ABQ7BSZ5_BRACR|nr:hypothetical protein DY000_02004710 [Brassica cretica]
MAAVRAFRTRCLGLESAACLDLQYTPASLVIAHHRGRLPAVLHGRGACILNMTSQTQIRGLARPAPVVRVACHRHLPPTGSCHRHGRASSRLVGSLGSKSAARLCPRYMPAVYQLHSTSSAQLHQAHLSCPNIHNFNLSFTKPEIPHIHMLCT